MSQEDERPASTGRPLQHSDNPNLASGADERKCLCGCERSLASKRRHAKFYEDACKSRAKRRRRDPLIDSPERRRRRRDGLDVKYAGHVRWQVRRELRRWGPGHALSPLICDDPAAAPDTEHADFYGISLWRPSDSFPKDEVYIGFRDGANPDPGWHSGPYWDLDGDGTYRRTPDPIGDAGITDYEEIERRGVIGPIEVRILPLSAGKPDEAMLELAKERPKRAECDHCKRMVAVDSFLEHLEGCNVIAVDFRRHRVTSLAELRDFLEAV